MDEIIVDPPPVVSREATAGETIPTNHPPEPLPSTSGIKKRKPEQEHLHPPKIPHHRGEKRSPERSNSSNRRKMSRNQGDKRGRTTDSSTNERKRNKDDSSSETEEPSAEKQQIGKQAKWRQFRDLVDSTDSTQNTSSSELTSEEDDLHKITPDNLEIEIMASSIKPTKGTEGAAGWDLRANQTLTLQPYSRSKVDLGLKAAIPTGYAGLLVARSRLASEGISPVGGLIDSDYRGPWIAILENNTSDPRRVQKGERICQVIFLRVRPVDWITVSQLSATVRDDKGFGSSGAL